MQDEDREKLQQLYDMANRLAAVCLDESVVPPQDAGDNGSREANEPNAVRDVPPADRLNGIASVMEWSVRNGKRPTRILMFAMIDTIREVAQQLTLRSQKRRKAMTQPNEPLRDFDASRCSASDWEYEQFVQPMEYDVDNDCPRCQGSGEVPTADYESYFGQNYKACPMCGGNGDR